MHACLHCVVMHNCMRHGMQGLDAAGWGPALRKRQSAPTRQLAAGPAAAAVRSADALLGSGGGQPSVARCSSECTRSPPCCSCIADCWLQVRVPLKAFPITYKYGLQRKGSHMELEVWYFASAS